MTATTLLNQYFDKIYVLTIKRMQERHALLAKNLEGLQYELFYGLDKNDITLEEYETNGIYNNQTYLKYNKDGTQMRLGVFCCAMGHKAIYEDMLKHKIKSALIIEDDAFLLQDNLEAIPAIFAQLPSTWELLYLGYDKNDRYSFGKKLKSIWYQIFPWHTLLKLRSSQFKKYYAKPLTKNIWQSGFHDCTHAYAITNMAAQKLIAMQTPLIFKSDTLLSYAVSLNQVEGYITKPKIFDQLSTKHNGSIASLVS
jgi:glycosyl transferase, family 25